MDTTKRPAGVAPCQRCGGTREIRRTARTPGGMAITEVDPCPACGVEGASNSFEAVDGRILSGPVGRPHDPRTCPWCNPAGVLGTPAPAAWMDPETRDVINAERKQDWLTHFGDGGKKKAAGYTVPLFFAAHGVPEDVAVRAWMGGASIEEAKALPTTCPHGTPHRWPCEQCDAHGVAVGEAQPTAQECDVANRMLDMLMREAHGTTVWPAHWLDVRGQLIAAIRNAGVGAAPHPLSLEAEVQRDAAGVNVGPAPLELSRDEADEMIRAADGHTKMSEVRELVQKAFRRGVAAARGVRVDAASSKTQQQERARQLAEDWHEGVPQDKQHEWACRAAGLLLHFADGVLSSDVVKEAYELLDGVSDIAMSPEWNERRKAVLDALEIHLGVMEDGRG